MEQWSRPPWKSEEPGLTSCEGDSSRKSAFLPHNRWGNSWMPTGRWSGWAGLGWAGLKRDRAAGEPARQVFPADTEAPWWQMWRTAGDGETFSCLHSRETLAELRAELLWSQQVFPLSKTGGCGGRELLRESNFPIRKSMLAAGLQPNLITLVHHTQTHTHLQA